MCLIAIMVLTAFCISLLLSLCGYRRKKSNIMAVFSQKIG